MGMNWQTKPQGASYSVVELDAGGRFSKSDVASDVADDVSSDVSSKVDLV